MLGGRRRGGGRGSPPARKALASICLHLFRTESEVLGALGKVVISVSGATTPGSLLELLLELLGGERRHQTGIQRGGGEGLTAKVQSHLSSRGSGLFCEDDTVCVVGSFLFSSAGFSPPPPGSSANRNTRTQNGTSHNKHSTALTTNISLIQSSPYS